MYVHVTVKVLKQRQYKTGFYAAVKTKAAAVCGGCVYWISWGEGGGVEGRGGISPPTSLS